MLILLLACTQTGGDQDADGYGADDCDDTSAAVHPGVTELCNGIDDNCDGAVDEGLLQTWYPDSDDDGYGDAAVPVIACAAPLDAVPDATDCDDDRADIHPGAVETCDGADEDCDGVVDDGLTTGGGYFADEDGDGWGGAAITACAPGPDALLTDGDCDDTRADVNPDQAEQCDDQDVDEDCDGSVDDADGDVHGQAPEYPDQDGDGYYDHVGDSPGVRCDPDPGYAVVGGDCDDADAARHPGAAEVCDDTDRDEDCDGLSDDADSSTDPASWLELYLDADGDGYGGLSAFGCDPAAGRVAEGGDCDDAVATVSPGGQDLCEDGTDQDCDGVDATCTSFSTVLDPDDARMVVSGAAAQGFGGGEFNAPIAVGDFDGDGRMDLAVGSTVDETSHGWIGQSVSLLPLTSGASAVADVRTAAWFPGATADYLAAVGDVDGDGTDDLYIGGSTVDDWGVWSGLHPDEESNAPNLTFDHSFALAADAGTLTGAPSAWVTTFDVDVSVWVGTEEVLSIPNIACTVLGKVADFNGDGLDDLWLGDNRHRMIEFEGRSGAAGVVDADEADAVVDLGYQGLSALDAGDVDGDGAADLVAQDGDALRFAHLGHGTWSTWATIEAAAGMNAFAVGDYDGDGLVDAAVSYDVSRYEELGLLLGPLSGTRAAEEGIPWDCPPPDSTCSVSPMTLPDMDADGDDELLLASSDALAGAGAVLLWVGR